MQPPQPEKLPGKKRWGRQVDDGHGRKLYVYLNDQDRLMVRPEATEKRTWGVPRHKGQRSVVAFRLVLWLTWRPPEAGEIACHLGCDNHMCLNPAHGRWGTQADNEYENSLLAPFKAQLAQQPVQDRASFIKHHHPTRHLLARQGFNWG